MFRFLMTLFIFLIILTLYFHIVYHLKKSNDLDIYETIYTNKQQLENICKLRQPIIFNYDYFPSCERETLMLAILSASSPKPCLPMFISVTP